MDPHNQNDDPSIKDASNENPTPIQPITTSSGTFGVQNAQSANPESNSNSEPNPSSSPAKEPDLASLDDTTAPSAPKPETIDPNQPLSPFAQKKSGQKLPIFKKLLIPTIVVFVLLILAIGTYFILKNRTVKESGAITMTGFEDPIIWQPILENFTKETKIKVEYTQVKQENYEKNMLEKFVTKSSSDIFPLRSDWFTKHRDKVVAPETEVKIPEYYAYAQSVLNKDNKPYGITFSQDSLALFYNPDLTGAVNGADWQYWDQIKTWAPSAVVKSGSTINTSAIPLGVGSNVNYSPEILTALIMQNYGVMADDTTNAVQYDQISQKTGVGEYYSGKEALDYFANFARADQPNYSWNKDMPNSLETFGTKKSKLYIGFAKDMTVLKNKYPLTNFEILPLPQIRNSEKVLSVAQFWSLSVSKDSVRKNNSWKLLEFIAKQENTSRLDLALKVPSPYKNIALADQEKTLSVFEKQSATATNWNKYDQAILDNDLVIASDDVVASSQTPAIAISASAKRSNEFIQTRKMQRKIPDDVVNNKIVRIWTLDKEDKGLVETMNEFARDYSDNQFIFTTVALKDLETRFIEETASDIGPDLFFLPEEQIPSWTNRLIPFFNDEQKIKFVKTNFDKFAYQNTLIKNKLYGLTLSKNMLVMAKNYNLIYLDNDLSANPATWDELITQTQKITKKSGSNINIAGVAMGASSTYSSDILTLMMLQNKAEITNSDRSATALHLPLAGTSTYPAQTALDKYRSFSDPASPNYTWSDSLPQDFELFRQGKLGYIFIYNSDVPTLKVDELKFSVQYSPVPQFSKDDTAIDLTHNTSAVIPIRNQNGPLGSSFLWYSINNFYNYTSRMAVNTPERKDNSDPFTLLGKGAISIYKGASPDVFDATMKKLIRGEITLDQMGSTINQSWRNTK